jgi:hypothetical protein
MLVTPSLGRLTSPYPLLDLLGDPPRRIFVVAVLAVTSDQREPMKRNLAIVLVGAALSAGCTADETPANESAWVERQTTSS